MRSGFGYEGPGGVEQDPEDSDTDKSELSDDDDADDVANNRLFNLFGELEEDNSNSE